MIIVLGSVIVRDGQLQAALAISREHVARSRAEPGCLAHAVHLDPDHADRLVFVEEWTDLPSLHAHFKVPASRAFAKALAGLSAQPPSMTLYDAAPLQGLG